MSGSLPDAASAGVRQPQARSASQLPFEGSFTVDSHSAFVPPNTLVITGTGEGTATHLGRSTVAWLDNVDTNTATSTGTFTLKAANGDQIFAATTGHEESFVPPNISSTIVIATIQGGTGRFVDASGMLTIHGVQAIDFVNGTASGSQTITGQINIEQ